MEKSTGNNGSQASRIEDALYDRLSKDRDIPDPKRQIQLPETGTAFVWDFGWPDLRLLVEVQGGTWRSKRTGHSTGAGIRRDARKNNAALLAGYRVLYITSDMVVRTDEALRWIRRAFGLPVEDPPPIKRMRKKIVATIGLVEDGNRISRQETVIAYQEEDWTPTTRWLAKKLRQKLKTRNLKVKSYYMTQGESTNAKKV